MKAAIVTAAGFGDALLMQIAAARLQRQGYETTTFSNHLGALARWFPGFEFRAQPSDASELTDFDEIVLQYDNSPKSVAIRALPQTQSLFASYVPTKHGVLKPRDVIFDRSRTMAENIGDKDLNNGLRPPAGLTHRRHLNRVAIHPVSSAPEKNWTRDRFLKLAERLSSEGWDPVFVAPPDEAAIWGGPVIRDLDALASTLFECGYFIGNDSGPGHLASNLGIPTVTIGPSREHLTLWRPGWATGGVVAPAGWVQKFKLTRTKWQFFITIDDVFKEFMSVSKKD